MKPGFSFKKKISSTHDITTSEELVASVSTLINVLHFLAEICVLGITVFFFATFLIAVLFTFYPQKTSDFFGYYYRQNTLNGFGGSYKIKPSKVLGAAIGPADVIPQTSVLADVLKPMTAVSLLLVKAADNPTYVKIVTNPVFAQDIIPQLPSQGPPGENGTNGVSGSIGLQGPTGFPGVNGQNGTNGSNGLNGTSVADVMTTIGDMLIRDSANITTRLPAGSSGQVLTISNGIPAWQSSMV